MNIISISKKLFEIWFKLWYTFAKKKIIMLNYPSNITRQQFEVIRPELENFHQRTKPRQVDLYDVFCAILYILKNES